MALFAAVLCLLVILPIGWLVVFAFTDRARNITLANFRTPGGGPGPPPRGGRPLRFVRPLWRGRFVPFLRPGAGCGPLGLFALAADSPTKPPTMGRFSSSPPNPELAAAASLPLLVLTV